LMPSQSWLPPLHEVTGFPTGPARMSPPPRGGCWGGRSGSATDFKPVRPQFGTCIVSRNGLSFRPATLPGSQACLTSIRSMPDFRDRECPARSDRVIGIPRPVARMRCRGNHPVRNAMSPPLCPFDSHSMITNSHRGRNDVVGLGASTVKRAMRFSSEFAIAEKRRRAHCRGIS